MQQNMSDDEHQHSPRSATRSPSSSSSDTESDYSELNTTNSVADQSHFAELNNDNFFDQSGPGADYTSVIEGLSSTTSNDRNDDFPAEPPKLPLIRRPTLLPILTDTDSELEIDGESTGRLSEEAMLSRRASVILKVGNKIWSVSEECRLNTQHKRFTRMI